MLQKLLFVCLICWFGESTSTRSPGIDFVGIGYNLLKGNPDGDLMKGGGVDPGLLTTRNILHLSPGDAPQEVIYQKRYSCARTKTTNIFYGTKSYQEKLNIGVDASGSANVGLASFAFSLSGGYKKALQDTQNKQTVFEDDQSICNKGHARFAIELAQIYKFSVSDNFAAAVCSLPSQYNEASYMKFLDTWGTHVTLEVDLGTKEIHRYQSSFSEFIHQVIKSGSVGVSLGGSYMGYGASLGVNVDKYKASSSHKSTIGSYQYTLTSGGSGLPEPIGLKVRTIDYALEPVYWQKMSDFTQKGFCSSGMSRTLSEIKGHVTHALSEYASYKQAHRGEDPQLRIPVTWPKGSYGLLKPKSGCPSGKHFTWYQGYRHQDTEDVFAGNSWSHNLHIDGHQGAGDIEQRFCIKGNVQATDYDMDWPAGDYCVYKYGHCPSGFNVGYIAWDDENGGNTNSKYGILPDGVYDDNTKEYFCCRNDGLPTTEIILPTEKPFYLLRHIRDCQRVRGTRVTEEWIEYDDEDSFFAWNYDGKGGDYPYDNGSKRNHILHFCYYEPVSASTAYTHYSPFNHQIIG